MATTNLRSVDADVDTVSDYCRALRILLVDLHDDPLDQELTTALVQILIHSHPTAHAALVRLHAQEKQS